MKNRITYLDSLKGIAILGVIFAHAGLNSLPIFGKFIGSIGPRGVQMFFIISALLTFKSLDSHKKNLKKWYYNKFLRLIPLYYISLVFYYFTVGFVPNYWTGYQPITKKTVYLNILLLNGLSPFSINAINVNWYIGTLVLFILIAPIIYKLINNLSKSIIFFIITWCIALILSPLITNLYIGDNAYIWASYWNNFSLLSELPVLAIGIILYYLIYKKENIKITNIVVTAILCMLLMIFEGYRAHKIVTISILFGIIIFILHKKDFKLINNKVFSTLGKYSYGLYLFHNPIISIVNSVFSKYFQNIYLPVLIVTVFTIILSMIISYLLTNFIEKPLVTKLRK